MKAITTIAVALLLCIPAIAQTGGIRGEIRRNYNIEREFVSGVPTAQFNTAPLLPAAGFTVGSTAITEARLLSFGRLLDAKTTVGTSFGGSGADDEAVMNQGTVTIPANTLSAGDVIKGRVVVAVPTTVSTDELSVRLRVGGLAGTVIASVIEQDVANDDLVIFDYEIVIRTATTAITSATTVPVLGGTPAILPSFAALTGLDLTAALTIVVTGEWSTENANSAIVQSFTAVVYGG